MPYQNIKTLRFLGLFILYLFLLSIGVIKLMPEAVMQAVIDATGLLVLALSKALGISATYVDNHVTVAGFRMHVNLECTALQFFIMFLAGIAAWPFHGAGYKAKGVFLGCVFLAAINIFRIVVLGLVGASLPSVFYFVHVYLWQGAFVVMVFATWMVWEGRGKVSWGLLRACLAGLTASAAGVLALGMLMPHYLKALSYAAGWYFSLMGHGADFTVSAVQNEMSYLYLEDLFYFPISVDVFDSVIFFALVFATTRIREYRPLTNMLLKGATVLFFVHLIFVVAAGYMVVLRAGGKTIQDFMWAMRGVSVTIPILLWFLLKNPGIPGLNKPGSPLEPDGTGQ